MANADGPVIPKPGVPKTLGILNVIFGVLLVLLGLCSVGGMLMAPAMVDFAEKTTKNAQAKIEADQNARIKSLDDREAAAKTDEEKKAIEQERASEAATKVQINPVDMSAATEVLHDPTVMGVSYVNLGTGLILHVMLIVAGVGLIRLTPWGRSLAVTWAGLQIVQLVIMTTASLVLVLPITQANNAKQIAKLEESVKGKGPGSPEAMSLQMTKMMAPLAVPMAVGQAVAGMIYPIVVLVLLNTTGARAACLPKRADDLEGF